MSSPRENTHSFIHEMIGVTRRQQERQCISSKDVVKMKEGYVGIVGSVGIHLVVGVQLLAVGSMPGSIPQCC